MKRFLGYITAAAGILLLAGAALRLFATAEPRPWWAWVLAGILAPASAVLPVVCRRAGIGPAWLAATALLRQLLAEVAIATDRISEVVGAVREYTYLDRAPVQRITVTAGLENTLVILRSRWKAGVTVSRSYAPDLPAIDAYGSELNQVWTNLIANAIDAMDGRGELAITAIPAPGADGVVVEIRDSGPGITEEVRRRIFDPFFTTKDLGAGTGLGLHISRSIVERHGGHLELASGDPGRTTFRVTLPAHLPPTAPEGPPASADG